MSATEDAITCAEDIAILTLLHRRVLYEPHDNVASSTLRLSSKDGRCLPFDKENDLVTTLAFLAGISDDSNHVLAIAVEEDAPAKKMKVVIAVNKARPQDGDAVLTKVKAKFETIFELLSKVQTDRISGLEDWIFEEIIAMCSNRILCRLRSPLALGGANQRKGKPFLGSQLTNAIDLIRTSTALSKAKEKKLTKASTGVLSLMDKFEHAAAGAGHYYLGDLANLVESVHTLTQDVELEAIIDTIPNTLLAPSTKKHLPRQLVKIGRYREAASLLYRLAKKYPIFQAAKIVPLNLDASLFPSPTLPPAGQAPNFSSILSRIRRYPIAPHQLSTVVSHLPKTSEHPDTVVEKAFRGALLESKVHAEIQIALWYDIHRPPTDNRRLVSAKNSSNLPRVIASTKEACAMCNVFLDFHGRFHTPGTHGRVYPCWKLPAWPTRPGIARKFNSKLEAMIRDGVRDLLSQPANPHPAPIESVVRFLNLPSNSTVAGRQDDAGDKIEAAPGQNDGSNGSGGTKRTGTTLKPPVTPPEGIGSRQPPRPQSFQPRMSELPPSPARSPLSGRSIRFEDEEEDEGISGLSLRPLSGSKLSILQRPPIPPRRSSLLNLLSMTGSVTGSSRPDLLSRKEVPEREEGEEGEQDRVPRKESQLRSLFSRPSFLRPALQPVIHQEKQVAHPQVSTPERRRRARSPLMPPSSPLVPEHEIPPPPSPILSSSSFTPALVATTTAVPRTPILSTTRAGVFRTALPAAMPVITTALPPTTPSIASLQPCPSSHPYCTILSTPSLPSSLYPPMPLTPGKSAFKRIYPPHPAVVIIAAPSGPKSFSRPDLGPSPIPGTVLMELFFSIDTPSPQILEQFDHYSASGSGAGCYEQGQAVDACQVYVEYLDEFEAAKVMAEVGGGGASDGSGGWGGGKAVVDARTLPFSGHGRGEEGVKVAAKDDCFFLRAGGAVVRISRVE